MGFFDDLHLPGADEDDEDYSGPEWLAAPEDVAAGVVPVELVLGQSADAAVFVTRIAAYPVGFEFDAVLITREPARGEYFELMHDPRRTAGEIPPELVRLGIAFADGRRTTSLGEPLGASTSVALTATGEEQSPAPARDIVMTPGGGSGSARRTTTSYWVWPLPPPGPLTFACEWPAFGIEERTVELDSALVRDAAERAHTVWPEQR